MTTRYSNFEDFEKEEFGTQLEEGNANESRKDIDAYSGNGNDIIDINKINNIFQDLGIEFGIYKEEKVKSTILGAVVEFEENRYRGFNRESRELTDYNQLGAISNLPILKLSVTKVKEGDLILHKNNNPYFVTAVMEEYVEVVNPMNASLDKILPVNNPLGIKTYTKLFPLGEFLGFKGETTDIQRIILWVLTMVGSKMYSDGIEVSNSRISEWTSKAEKYTELLVPFASVAFAAYVMNEGNEFGIKNIWKTAKSSIGIDFECLKDKKSLKKIGAIGGLAIALGVKYKKDSVKAIDQDADEKEMESQLDKLIKAIKPFKVSFMKILPTALTICAVALLKNDKFDILKSQVEGGFYIIQDVVCEKLHVPEEVFSKENLKKVGVLSLVALVAFAVYGKRLKKDKNVKDANNLLEQIIPIIAPLVPMLVIIIPKLKDNFKEYGIECDEKENSEEENIVTEEMSKENSEEESIVTEEMPEENKANKEGSDSEEKDVDNKDNGNIGNIGNIDDDLENIDEQ